jgi:hypothetical protein
MPPATEEKPPPPWEHSEAKKQLARDIIDGTVTDNMAAANVFLMRPEFQLYKKKNFVPNFKRLKKKIRERGQYARADHAALARDLVLHPVAPLTHGGYPRWDGSDAERWLKIDIDNDLDDEMAPQELWAMRPAYMLFPKKVFRDHINQERRSRREKGYWLHKMCLKKKPVFY